VVDYQLNTKNVICIIMIAIVILNIIFSLRSDIDSNKAKNQNRLSFIFRY